MGGNALKSCVTRRYAAEEYFKMCNLTGNTFNQIFPDCRFAIIPAYKSKESFGDMDILISSTELPSNWVEIIKETFCPRQMVKNGNVLSFEHRQLQTDVIVCSEEEFDASLSYYSYNDLGNLCGRIAHSLGLKLGHDGLSYNFRDGTYHFKNVVLLTNWEDILPVLGLSYERYAAGFDTLEDIFKFVVSSPFFHKDIFHLENRNHAARVRDEKRRTYMEFLKWIESYNETSHQTISSELHKLYSKDKSHPLDYLFDIIPNFKEIHEQVTAEWQVDIKFKTLYNGYLVKEWTGLEGKELGKFMTFCKEDQPQLKDLITNMNEDCIEWFVNYMKQKYDGTLPKIDLKVILAGEKNESL